MKTLQGKRACAGGVEDGHGSAGRPRGPRGPCGGSGGSECKRDWKELHAGRTWRQSRERQEASGRRKRPGCGYKPTMCDAPKFAGICHRGRRGPPRECSVPGPSRWKVAVGCPCLSPLPPRQGPALHIVGAQQGSAGCLRRQELGQPTQARIRTSNLHIFFPLSNVWHKIQMNQRFQGQSFNYIPASFSADKNVNSLLTLALAALPPPPRLASPLSR